MTIQGCAICAFVLKSIQNFVDLDDLNQTTLTRLQALTVSEKYSQRSSRGKREGIGRVCLACLKLLIMDMLGMTVWHGP